MQDPYPTSGARDAARQDKVKVVAIFDLETSSGPSEAPWGQTG